VAICVDPGIDAAAEADRRDDAELPERAFRVFYERYFDLAYGFISRYGIGANDVEDLVQRVFVVVQDRADEIGQLEKPEAWLRAIAVRVVHEHYRWRRVRRAHAWLVEHSWAGRAVDERTPERAALASEAIGRAQLVLQRMSAKLRDALVLLDIEELSAREAAEILGVPENTVRSRRALARSEFRKLWTETSRRRDRR
jgi:RNA polymerase sigma-70 factor (ECF subfamily)